MGKLTWNDFDNIAFALYEKFPEVDPTHVRFTDLHKWITELEGFDDDPLKSNEASVPFFGHLVIGGVSEAFSALPVPLVGRRAEGRSDEFERIRCHGVARP